MIKRILSNGNINIPKKFRQLLPSNNVDIKLVEIETAPGVVKNVIILEPIGEDKKAYTVYE